MHSVTRSIVCEMNIFLFIIAPVKEYNILRSRTHGHYYSIYLIPGMTQVYLDVFNLYAHTIHVYSRALSIFK